MVPPIVEGAHKAGRIRNYCLEHGLRLDLSHAYSDSLSDYPMLSVVGRPCAVNPDRALRSHARAYEWPILDLEVTLRFALALAAAALAAPLQAQTAAPAPRSARDERVEAMQQEIAGAMLRNGVPGAAVALVDERGIAWMGGFGDADPSSARLSTPTTPFAAAALTPVIVGLLAARYAAMNSAPRKEGEPPRAPLDEPVDAPALGLVDPFAPASPITLAALLDQTAGLEDLTPAELLTSPELTPLLGDVLTLRAHRSRWAPGSRFSPSRAGIDAAANQLERWSRRPLFTIADAELFTPLGMGASSLRPDAALLSALAVGHQGKRAQPWREPLSWGALGLITSAQDFASLLRMLIAQGLAQSGPARGQQLLPGSLVARVERGPALDDTALAAPGLGTVPLVAEGHLAFGQQGVFDGGAAALFWFPRGADRLRGAAQRPEPRGPR